MPYCHVKGDIPPFATLTVDPDDGPTYVDTAGENGKIEGMVWFFRNTNARLFLDDQGWPATRTTSSTSPSRATVPLAAEAGVTGTS